MLFSGCASPANRAGPEATAQQGVLNVDDLAPIIGALVDQSIDESQTEIVNDVWPWLVAGGGAFSVFVLAAVVVTLYWIRTNSYLRQKPVWEQRREGRHHKLD